MRLTRREFDRVVQRAYRRIPPEIRRRMDNVVLTVRRRPDPETLRQMGYRPDEPLLGLFEGASLAERSFFSPTPAQPDRIYIFQEPLEEMCRTMAELEREIEITVVHEVAHFLGINEERLQELGYG